MACLTLKGMLVPLSWVGAWVCARSLKVLLADSGEQVDMLGGLDGPPAPKLPPPPSSTTPLSSAAAAAGKPAAPAPKDPFDLLGACSACACVHVCMCACARQAGPFGGQREHTF